MKSPGQLVTEGGGIDCLGRRLHKLKIMIIFSLLCHFFLLFCQNHSNAYHILSPDSPRLILSLSGGRFWLKQWVLANAVERHWVFSDLWLAFFFFFWAFLHHLKYGLEETSLLWGKLLILFSLSKCGIIRSNCLCPVKAISQNWNAAAGKTEFGGAKLAETNSNRILFKTLFCLKKKKKVVKLVWNKIWRKKKQTTKTLLERIST